MIGELKGDTILKLNHLIKLQTKLWIIKLQNYNYNRMDQKTLDQSIQEEYERFNKNQDLIHET